jgi:RNA polymerase sigma factor (sigma-70 family)
MTNEVVPRRLNAEDIDRVLRDHRPAYVRANLGPALAAHESSADVVQSVCHDLLVEHRELEYCGDAALRAWLFRAVLRKIWQHDRHRRAKKRAAPPPPPNAAHEDQAQVLLGGYAHLATPSREVLTREHLTMLEQALADLSKDDRELIALRKIEGLPHAEIAALTGKSVAACKQGLRRALVRLAAKLERLGVGDALAGDD